MKLFKFLNRKRIITLSLTLFLFLVYTLLGALYQYTNLLTDYPRFARAMLVVTMIYVLGGCILHTLGYVKATKVLGTLVFLALCVFLFFAVMWYDFVIFVLCIYLVLHRSVNLCDSEVCNINQLDDASQLKDNPTE